MSESSDPLLAELVSRLLWDGSVLVVLMADLSEDAKESFRAKARDLQNRIAKASMTFASLPEDEQLAWGLAHFEGLTEEITKLIREIREASDK